MLKEVDQAMVGGWDGGDRVCFEMREEGLERMR